MHGRDDALDDLRLFTSWVASVDRGCWFAVGEEKGTGVRLREASSQTGLLDAILIGNLKWLHIF